MRSIRKYVWSNDLSTSSAVAQLGDEIIGWSMWPTARILLVRHDDIAYERFNPRCDLLGLPHLHTSLREMIPPPLTWKTCAVNSQHRCRNSRRHGEGHAGESAGIPKARARKQQAKAECLAMQPNAQQNRR